MLIDPEKEVKKWRDDLTSITGVDSVESMTVEKLTKNSKFTREAMARFLCKANTVIQRQLHYCRHVEEKKKEEIKKVKLETSDEIMRLQQQVVDLQQSLLAEKNRQLEDLRETVVKSVGETVKAEIKSYSTVVQSNSDGRGTVKSTNLQSVVKKVVEEQDRSKSLMIFGMAEDRDKKLHNKVGDLLLELNLKPQIEVCRIGVSGDKKRTRPVKVRVGSAATAMEVLNRAKQLKNSDQFAKVFISPDSSPTQRAEQEKLVLELKRKATDEADKHHFIRGGIIVSVNK